MRPPKSVIRCLGRIHAAIYRRTRGGRLSSFGGAQVLLLTTTGRQTGATRTAPLLCIRDGDAFVVVGSMGGHDSHPAWVHNLRAQPHASIQVGDELIPVDARRVVGDEWARLWARLVDIYPGYDAYRHRTTRTFAIFSLTRSSRRARS